MKFFFLKKVCIVNLFMIVFNSLRGAVYCIVVANGGIDAFNQILVLFRKEELHEEKQR